MREILFKARRLDNGEWVEGYYLQLQFFGMEIHMVAETNGSECLNSYQVDPATLCQFTGLYDKNGARIWEGDIVLLGDNPIHDGSKTKCIYSQPRAQFIYEFLDGDYKGKCTDMYDDWRSYTRLGSVHDGEADNE